MADVNDLTWRTATTADAPAASRLLNRLHAETGFGREATPDLVEHFWRTRTRPERVRLAFAPDGEPVAYGLLGNPAGPERRMELPGAVLRAWQGLGVGRRMVEWQLSQVPEGWFPVFGTDAADEPAARLYARYGFVPERHYITMARDTATPVSVSTLDGLSITPFRPELARALWAAHMEAFTGHFAWYPSTYEEWSGRSMGNPEFRPDLTFLACDGDEVAGYLISYNHDDPVLISTIGTRKAWRGRGIASALIGTAILAARQAGHASARLMVDSANGSGAAGVYERAGFTETGRRISYARQP
ncbi:GNAT family N-acetyltransferase [Longispora albida]|uniref:GNAT family N-acetyltransferase n=1 Tax=Longispora albida TaxID=203523 RepID=UPI0003760DA2|nr:GNAT family N-acetyltransferase [Longispora albida]